MHYNTGFEIYQKGMSCKSEKVLNNGNLEEDQYTISLTPMLQDPYTV